MTRAITLLSIVAVVSGSALAEPATPVTNAVSDKPAGQPAAGQPAGGAKTAEEAKAFIRRVNEDLKRLYTDAARADWVKNTHITEDTEILSAQAAEKVMTYTAQAIKDARAFDGVKVDADTARALLLLRLAADLPAPNDPKKTTELAELASKMTSMYGKGKHCKKAKNGKEECRDLEQLTEVMQKSRDYNELLEAWNGWHTVSPPMRQMYGRYVALSNEGARDLGFADVATMWRSRYDMPPEAFEPEMDRLWGQLKPLYQDLHCYVRGKLAQKYAGKMKDQGPIPAHLLGNMWAQEWANVYELVEPYPGEAALDVTAALKKKGVTEVQMVKMGEDFFTSLGMKKLPETFWTRSQFLKPADREVVCHASAWDVTYDNDARIKMCIKPDEDNLITIHHELGHIYYYQYYHKLPVLFQQGANDGFHEAIGDALTLSINPEYYKKKGLIDVVPQNDKGLIDLQLKDALDKVAFLPFGLLMDKWRWDVFSGKTKEAEYNKRWWQLRTEYQGIAPASARDEKNFDPGAKYHIPANVPYARYFLARILQFQFHQALCKAAGHQGPLHTCSIYGNKAAGKKLQALLETGASRPWPEALERLTGTKQMDATPMVDYFAPLQKWLKEQNAGKQCGW
jgi:peptidyl-dipeptidase A